MIAGDSQSNQEAGKNYIMIAYYCDINIILQASFETRSEQNRISAYNSIMKRLTNKVHKVDIQILYNESSAEYKRVITEKWKAQYRLVTPNVHSKEFCWTSNTHVQSTLPISLGRHGPWIYQVHVGHTTSSQRGLVVRAKSFGISYARGHRFRTAVSKAWELLEGKIRCWGPRAVANSHAAG